MALIQIKRGTAAQWTDANPILAEGEPGVETDTGLLKVGTGLDNWAALPYAGADPQALAAKQDVSEKDQPGGYPGLDGSGLVAVGQIPPGLLVDGVNRVGDTFQFTSGGTNVGDPVSLIVEVLDGGSPSTTAESSIDGGTL